MKRAEWIEDAAAQREMENAAERDALMARVAEYEDSLRKAQSWYEEVAALTARVAELERHCMKYQARVAQLEAACRERAARLVLR